MTLDDLFDLFYLTKNFFEKNNFLENFWGWGVGPLIFFEKYLTKTFFRKNNFFENFWGWGVGPLIFPRNISSKTFLGKNIFFENFCGWRGGGPRPPTPVSKLRPGSLKRDDGDVEITKFLWGDRHTYGPKNALSRPNVDPSDDHRPICL